jgi:hypothetical protein
MRAYAITATIPTARQVPTFYLLANVQGITSEGHAVRIARTILGADATITAVETTLGASDA